MKTPYILALLFALAFVTGAKKFPPSEQKVMAQPYVVTCPACEKTNPLKPYDLTSNGSHAIPEGNAKETSLWFKCPEKGCKTKFYRNGPDIIIRTEIFRAVPIVTNNPLPMVSFEWTNKAGTNIIRPKIPRVITNMPPALPSPSHK